MGSEREELLHGVKLAAVAVISAVLTASVVIGAGHALQPRQIQAAPAEAAQDAILIHTAG
ncbi:hypothetical protein ASG17_03100 [Brevundimonas sp. Leaf363]|uniref:hypothetical protein n=1 Tax=Brevundimonas sp. Leaf363 TaxID=1736353 RepID=UPI0006F88DBB|nr:hypothetical protein [Brevundimonas sp. Leaf363]KQS55101.1 hypothetical protein ASG17_03100 [Brevundimonas sp. Leaf363]